MFVMLPITLKTFVHPHNVYKLEYPAHWDQITQKDGESCGFGPHDRDDVGLWISILPASIDTDRLAQDLPSLMKDALGKSGAANPRPDPSLHHHALVADMTKEGEGGHYWIIAGGDVVLFASSQVPAAERDEWNPPFQKLMESLQITRDRELINRQVANEVLRQLRERHPDQEFEFDEENRIRGKGQMVFLSNVCREVQRAPERKDSIIKNFVKNLSRSAHADIGEERWEDAKPRILPVLKPRDYLDPEGPTQHLLTQEWLAGVVICYVIKSKKFFRFVTGWDVDRWSTTATDLHQLAIENLSKLPWPKQLIGAKVRNSGRVIVVDTEDGLASSRLLDPNLHRIFREPLGSPFWAGIPNRNTLVLFSDRRALKQKIGRRLHKDCRSSAYSITSRPFLVTPDGVAPAAESK
jgi:uncharacterized protein YtpQ (UPF0354 family)